MTKSRRVMAVIVAALLIAAMRLQKEKEPEKLAVWPRR